MRATIIPGTAPDDQVGELLGGRDTQAGEPVDCPPGCPCLCHTDVEDPGPEHDPSCLWADPDFGSGPPSPIGTLQLCDAAISGLLDAAAVDPDLRRALRPGSDLFELLCRAEAALQGRPPEEVIAERRAQVPQGPRLLLSLREWSAVKAREIQGEGVLGSHWPDKASGSCAAGGRSG